MWSGLTSISMTMDKKKWTEILDQLELGQVRAAYLEDGQWKANREVKEAILAAFGGGENIEYSNIYEGFVDSDSFPPRKFNVSHKVRLVPGGSAVRRAAYLAPGTIVMPPAYINMGAYVDEGSMIDSHVLVGSCAQVGKNVHLSAGVQIGGVLEPIGLAPVIIEDNCFVGAGSVIVEGMQLKEGAVLAPGVTLSKSIPVFDCVNERRLEKGSPIPENAVVIPGSRPVNNAWAQEQGLNMACPLIVKYRDAQSDASLELEEALR